MNGSQDLYIGVLLIIDIFQASRVIHRPEGGSEFLCDSWLIPRCLVRNT